MKKIYLGIPLSILLLMLCLGFYTVFTAGVPSIGVNSLLEREYALQFQKHISPQFPGKEPLQELSTFMNGFYKFTGFRPQGGTQLLLPITNDAADHGSALPPQEPQEQPTEEPTEPDSSTEPVEEEQTEATEPPAPTEESTEATEQPIDEPPVEVLGQILLLGDRAIELPGANYRVIETYATSVNRIAEALDGVEVYSVLVPNAAGLYAPEAFRSGEDDQQRMISHAYSHMNDRVHKVDAFTPLYENRDKYLYFRTDHHWTHLGSYYAYSALCREMGILPVLIREFRSGEYDSFLGSMYGFLSDYPQREILKENPDSLTYYIPKAETSVKYYEDASLGYGGKIQAIYPLSENRSNKYLCFLGGDHPITVLETDCAEERTCILIKESYGNAFSTWLTSHYSKIICIDPREFNRSGKPSLDLKEFAARVEADDCIILNYPIMINSSAYSSWLSRLIP